MNYQKLNTIANKIEALADEGLDIAEGTEPVSSPLLNLLGSVSQLRDAIHHAKGQERP